MSAVCWTRRAGCSPKRREPGVRKPVFRLAVALLVTTLTAGAALIGAGPVQAQRAAAPLTMSVVDVSPNSPAVTTKPRPLTFTLQLVNTTSTPVHVSISVSRGDPIGSTNALDSAIAHPRPPSPALVSPLSVTRTVDLPANGAPRRTTITTTTATTAHDGVCLCHKAIYPFWFIGSYTTGGTQRRGDRADSGAVVHRAARQEPGELGVAAAGPTAPAAALERVPRRRARRRGRHRRPAVPPAAGRQEGLGDGADDRGDRSGPDRRARGHGRRPLPGQGTDRHGRRIRCRRRTRLAEDPAARP